MASANAISCTAVEPASRMWYPESEIALKRGASVAHQATRSDGEPQARPRRVDVGAARDVLLEHVVLRRAAHRRRRDALQLGRDDVHRDQHGRRRVDRHRGRDLVERDAVEERRDVVERVDRDAHAPDLAERARIVGVEPHLRGQVERDREARLALREQEAEALVGLRRRAVAGVLADRPRPRAVAVVAQPARERVGAGLADAPGIARVAGAVDRLYLDARGRLAPLAHASAPTSTTIFPRCAFSRIIWCGSGHSSKGNVRDSTGRILRSAISWLAR